MLLDVTGDFSKLALSFFLGCAIGLEREISDKPAGLRTNVLICLGATLFTMLSARWPAITSGVFDAHIAAQIVTGIGFLGAGAIMREGEHVIGLTTAATIWMVAAIGMAVGMGYGHLAAAATMAALIVQVALTRMDILIDLMRRRHTFRIVSDPDEHAVETISRIFKQNEIRVMHHKVMKKNNLYHSEWWTSGTQAGQSRAAEQLLKSDKVMEVTY